MKRLITLVLLAATQISHAQSWTVPAATSDLETDGSTNNVHITNNLGIGIYPNATDNLSVSKNILMDYPSDADYNNIHTNSVNFGLRLEAGTTDANSPSLKLCGASHSTFDGGLDFTAYSSATSANAVGFKFSHLVNNASSSVGLVYILKNGRVGIGVGSPSQKLEIMDGNISINSTSDAADRKLMANTTHKGLQLVANTAQTDGPAIYMIGGAAATDAGTMALSNYGPNARFGFYKYDLTYPTSPMLEQLEIQNNGNISMLRRTDAEYRQIEAHTLLGRLSMHSNYASNNGSTIELWGNNNEYAGEIHFIDYGSSNFIFQQYKPSLNVFDPQVQITSLGDIIMPRLVAEDAQMRTIGGACHGGLLALRSGIANTDGSGLELFGDTHSTYPGQMHLIDRGSNGQFQFINYQPTYGFMVQAKIDGAGDHYLYSPINDGDRRKIVGKNNAGSLSIGVENTSNLGARIEMFSPGFTPDANKKGAITFIDDEASNPTGTGFNFMNHNTSDVSLMRIQKNGKVAIGSTNMDISSANYKLFVETGIMTEHVRVAIENSGQWSDYVFSKDYKLMPLVDVTNYIEKHQHLPEMPSADDVVKSGIDLGAMDAKLLQKIEELTLYVAQQQKEIEELKAQINPNH